MPDPKSPIRILHLEDSPHDAALIQDRLEAGGLRCDIVCVDSKQRFAAALAGDSFDLILCDYNLPDYDGLLALKLAREKQPDAPVMVISGSLGEEEAVKCLHSGATDYLLKQRLERLPSAITRTLQEAAEHRQRQQAEEELKKLSSAVNQTSNCVFITDRQGVIEYVNPAFERTTGYAREEVIGKTPRLLKSGQHDQKYYEALWNTVLAGRSFSAELVNRKKSGELYHTQQAITPIRDPHGQITHFVSTGHDITERVRAEEARKLFRALVDQSHDTIEVVDPETGRFLDVNERGCLDTGYRREEFLALSVSDLDPTVAPSVFSNIMRELRKAGVRMWEGIRRRKDGSTFPVEVNIRYVQFDRDYVVSVVRDITERKQVERQMLRTQRLESIGNLASGVAHDLNNALAPIMMATELLRLEYPEDTASGYLEMIQASAKRGADLVKQLLTFAKGTEGERLLVQPQHLLKEMQKLINGTFPKNIQLQTHYAKNLQTILGDATQLHQVLLNLCVNARDAMPEGGTLTLEAENMELDAVQANTVLDAKPGHYAVWRVTDTGTGIPPEILEHIFEPFFSTKGPDKGTGLGLSTMIGIVKSHGGFVQVHSTPGQGSTFAVYLPAYGSDAGDTSLLTKTDTTFRGHGETILVVDDEASVRNVLRAVLTELNFKVLTAADGTAALIQVTEQPAQLRAVITDMHMPHMDGLSFARVLRARSPQTGIIVTSGRLDEPQADEFKKLGVNAVLEKPFTQEKLIEALKTVFMK